MDWIIWVIVIVLVIAIVWWLMNRNKSRNSSSTPAPAAMEPANTASLPDAAAATAGVAGLAGVTNLGKAAAEGSGPTGEESPRDPAREPTLQPAPESVDESIADEPAELKARKDQEAAVPSPTPGLTVEEPVVAAPVVEEPVVEEPVVAQPAVDIDATLQSADTVQSTDAVHSADTVHSADAGDVDDWDAGDSEPAGKDHAADKAEWESSWTDSSGAPVHHHEYTDAHSPTLPGAESAAAEDPTTSGHLAAEHPYGTGSSSTAGDAYPVKANATAMTYHDEDTADYADVAADVWFESAAHAEAAGFRPPRRNRH
ncbi:hypothetical protein AB4Y77_00465 [Paenarthrobacter sp. YAF11_1]|uniref:sunset domain-containing protein n=1 Tax=Micrococcaceae TaxID=1268 RepID=UPI002883538E|nr:MULTISPECIES: hypothetical protein [unclassified Arthrobacter]